MTKQQSVMLGVIGVLLIIGSLASLQYPDFSQWFPVILLFGGVTTWIAIGRYRAA